MGAFQLEVDKLSMCNETSCTHYREIINQIFEVELDFEKYVKRTFPHVLLIAYQGSIYLYT